MPPFEPVPAAASTRAIRCAFMTTSLVPASSLEQAVGYQAASPVLFLG